MSNKTLARLRLGPTRHAWRPFVARACRAPTTRAASYLHAGIHFGNSARMQGSTPLKVSGLHERRRARRVPRRLWGGTAQPAGRLQAVLREHDPRRDDRPARGERRHRGGTPYSVRHHRPDHGGHQAGGGRRLSRVQRHGAHLPRPGADERRREVDGDRAAPVQSARARDVGQVRVLERLRHRDDERTRGGARRRLDRRPGRSRPVAHLRGRRGLHEAARRRTAADAAPIRHHAEAPRWRFRWARRARTGSSRRCSTGRPTSPSSSSPTARSRSTTSSSSKTTRSSSRCTRRRRWSARRH